jgi:hypothetical protein
MVIGFASVGAVRATTLERSVLEGRARSTDQPRIGDWRPRGAVAPRSEEIA